MSRWPALVLAAAVFITPFVVGCEDHDRDHGDRDRVYRSDEHHDYNHHDSDRGYYDRY